MSAPAHEEDAQPGGSIVTVLRVLRERWLLVAFVTLACGGASLALSLRTTKEYSATSSLLSRQGSDNLLGLGGQDQGDPARDQGTALLLVQSTRVAERVKDALGLPETPSDLLSEITANAEPDADLIRVTAVDEDPRRATAVANEFAAQFVAYRREVQRDSATRAVDVLRTQLDQTPKAEADARASLRQEIVRLTALEGAGGGAEVVDRATAPTDPTSPRPKRDAALGLMLGLVAGLALAFLADLFDRRLKTVEQFEARLRMRAAAVIAAGSKRDAVEPFRILRGALGVGGLQERCVVVVTSPGPGEGKSLVATGLARTFAMTGERVVLVECDLRRPTLSRAFGLADDGRGLTTALSGEVPAADLVRVADAALPSLRLLPAGPPPLDAAELLRTRAMSDVLLDLAEEFDIVVLDAPPLLPVADARALLDHPAVDAHVLVTRAYRTTRQAVDRARALLERRVPREVALVVNGVRATDVEYAPHPAPAPRALTGAQTRRRR